MTSRVYVGRLNYEVRERDLERFFKGFGRIREISIKNGFGFVEFDDHRDADDAVYELNGKELLGDRVSVELARGIRRGADYYRSRAASRSPPRRRYGPPTRTEYQLTVENLSSRVSWQDLKDYMRQAGEVTYADAHRLRRNEGVVEFATYSDMKNALDKLDNTDLSGRRIRLIEEKRRSKSRSRSRSRSRRRRSPSRSRSRSRRRSRSRSPVKRRSRSRSRSRSASRRGRSRSRSRSAKRRSHSRTPVKRRSRSASRSRSRSRSPAPKRRASSKDPPPPDLLGQSPSSEAWENILTTTSPAPGHQTRWRRGMA
ncbi:hypothetical protein HPB51_010577 [Rhipicephalus microplus]|uniref:RRM domain-containing protein n=1 Tax=Rhipicephalus microplus TaxID=6941 RepID=A0A9J6E7U9_RHIMP|nr:hypothetical protein HPB51_010577 [Rhipicephalus microplus]